MDKARVRANTQSAYIPLIQILFKCFFEQINDKRDVTNEATNQKSLVKSFALNPGLHPQPSQSTINFEFIALYGTYKTMYTTIGMARKTSFFRYFFIVIFLSKNHI